MKCARIIGRVFCTRQYETLDCKRLLLIQPLAWEDGKERGGPIVAADACGSGSSEFVYWVASREAAVAFDDLPPVDAAVIGIIEGHQVKEFRQRTEKA
ncbi:MAG: EutN/CcmL family microcompartment protein [Elusimicrobiota bacterium]